MISRELIHKIILISVLPPISLIAKSSLICAILRALLKIKIILHQLLKLIQSTSSSSLISNGSRLSGPTMIHLDRHLWWTSGVLLFIRRIPISPLISLYRYLLWATLKHLKKDWDSIHLVVLETITHCCHEVCNSLAGCFPLLSSNVVFKHVW